MLLHWVQDFTLGEAVMNLRITAWPHLGIGDEVLVEHSVPTFDFDDLAVFGWLAVPLVTAVPLVPVVLVGEVMLRWIPHGLRHE